MPVPFSRKAIEDALASWVSTQCFLAMSGSDARVLWLNQKTGPEVPSYAHATLFIPVASIKLGQDELRVEANQLFTQAHATISLNESTLGDFAPGQLFTLKNTAGLSSTWEVTGTGVVAPGHYPFGPFVIVDPDFPEQDIVTQLVNDINNADVGFLAFDNGDLTVNVLQEVGGLSGNTTVTENVEGFDFTDFTGAVEVPPSAGQELKLNACGLRKFTLSVNVYTDTNDPDNDATSIMDSLHSSLGLPSVQATLQAAGLSVIDDGQILRLDGIAGDRFTQRAQLDVIFGIAANVSELTGYMATIEAQETILDADDSEVINDTITFQAQDT